jgi:phenylacetate-CoA ligase
MSTRDDARLTDGQRGGPGRTGAGRTPGPSWARIAGPGSRVRLADDLGVLDRTGIDELQRHNLTALVEAARRTPAVYRRWPGLDGVTAVADLPRLPLLSPRELAAGGPPHSDELLLAGDGSGLVLRSSGTAGQTKTMFHSWQFKQQVDFLGARGVRACLPEPPRRVANCMYAGELNGGFLFVLDASRLLSAQLFPIGSGAAARFTADVIAEFSIDTVVAAPAYLVGLVTGAPEGALASLRNLLFLGEGMGAARRRAISEVAPDLTVRSMSYSANETGPIGYQCGHLDDRTHHVHEDAMAVEIVDERTGEPVPLGEVGEVVVTPLKDTGMVLLRYRIGDRGYLEARTCPCGDASRLLTLLGRTAQSATIDGWTISSDELMSGLGKLGVDDPADCQLQVDWELGDYRVRLLLSPRTPEGITAEAVAASLRGKYHLNKILTGSRCVSFTVERVGVERFARTERGKVPIFVQRM